MPDHEHYYTIDIAGVTRDLQKLEVAEGVTIAILNILGDTKLVTAAAKGLKEKLVSLDIDVLVTAEAKSIPLIHALSYEMDNKPYVVLRKVYKPYMGDALSSETLSITTGSTQNLFLDEKDRDRINGKNVVLIDDVISTGSTLQGMRLIAEKAGANIIGEAAILTEGDRAKWTNVISLGHLPVWLDES